MTLSLGQLSQPITDEFMAVYYRFLSNRGISSFLGTNSLGNCMNEWGRIIEHSEQDQLYYYAPEFSYSLHAVTDKIFVHNGNDISFGTYYNPLQLPMSIYLKADSLEDALDMYFGIKKITYTYNYTTRFKKLFTRDQYETVTCVGELEYYRTLNPHITWKNWWESNPFDWHYYGIYEWFENVETLDGFNFAHPRDFSCQVGGLYHQTDNDAHPDGGYQERRRKFRQGGDIDIIYLWDRVNPSYGNTDDGRVGLGYFLRIPPFSVHHFFPRGTYSATGKAHNTAILDDGGNDIAGTTYGEKTAPFFINHRGERAESYATCGIVAGNEITFTGTGELNVEYFSFEYN